MSDNLRHPEGDDVLKITAGRFQAVMRKATYAVKTSGKRVVKFYEA